MANLPNEIKLTLHAQQRLAERKDADMKYNTKNLMKSSVKWYNKDDLIYDCALYRHSCYTTRKSNQIGYITDGDIEVIYNKGTKTAITVLEVKDKFKPITQFINPSLLKKMEIKKENKKKMKEETVLEGCPDCGRTDVELTSSGMYKGLCHNCKTRKQNMKSRGKEYIPYKDLPIEEKTKIDNMRKMQEERKERKEALENIVVPGAPTTIPIVENYYQVKAEQNPAIAQVKEIPIIKTPSKDTFDPLSDQNSFVATLRSCGCEIPEENLREVLDVLINTDKLKSIFMTIAKSNSQQAILDLEQALGIVEKKLQHDWEYNGFQEADDIKFKGFLTWRRVLKGAIFFWKKLYETNTIIEMQRAWNSYTQDPNDKIPMAGDTIKEDRMDSRMKRYQITTESVSTIFNTRRPFTRVFYATNKDEAYKTFVKWMEDRQLHENKSKTTITELKNEGEDGRNGN